VTPAEEVGAVLVAWNSMAWLPGAVRSLTAQSRPPSAIVVVDNASEDGVGDFLAREHPGVIYRRNETNEGFAAAVNQGIHTLATPWILTLNPDVVLDPRYLERLLDAAGERPKAGSLTGLLLRPDGSVDSAGLGLHRFLLRPLDRRVAPATNGTGAEDVFGVCAAAALYRRAMLEDVRYEDAVFDPAFFAYFEDADLAWRARHRGWRAYCVPGAQGIHARGASGGEATRDGTLRSQRNRYLMLYKNLPGIRFAIDLAPILCIEAARMLRHPGTQPAGLVRSLKLLPQRRGWRDRIQRTATASGSWYLRS